jgi:hypothetical protein
MTNCIIPGGAGHAKVSSFRDAVEAIAPALDSVELWLTPTIEQDFEMRGAFPALRAAHAVARRSASGWGLHFLQADLAEALLADCMTRKAEVAGGMLNAYHGHERRLREAIKEARERDAAFSAAGPRRVKGWGDTERWIGTSAQFRTMGIKAFPGEGDGVSRAKLKTKDSRGFAAQVCRSTSLWAGLFEVTITTPRKELAKPAQPSQSAQDLSQLAPSQGAFRQRLTRCLEVIAIELRDRMQQELGYRYTKEAVDEFMDAMAEARETLKAGTVVGRSRDQEIQRQAAQRAKDDKPLQDFLARLGDLPPEPEA